MSISKAVDFFVDEYNALGINKTYFPSGCYAAMLELLLKLKKKDYVEQDEKLELIKKSYRAIKNIKVDELKNGALLAVAKRLFTLDVTATDVDFMLEVSDKVKALTESEIENAVIPEPLLIQ